MGNLEKWAIFSLLDQEFLKKIKIAIVFGNHGNEAMFVTKDDEVYAMGSNSAGCLGFGDLQSSLHPRKVESLCGKGLTGFSYGSGPHVVAISASSGEVYSWGHNGYCEIGNGSASQCPQPTLVASALSGRRVTQVACGSHHTLVLTAEGEVYAWGQNNCGQIGSGINNTNTGSPRKVAAAIGGRKAVAVACGQACSMAVLDSGEVYGWGYNGNGQLGLGHNVNQMNPCRISGLQGVVVTKLECGYSHSLALSDLGVLYAWGANNHGQLGSGNKANLCNPTPITSEMGRVVDIASSHYAHTSVALTQNDKVFMWGQCRGQCVTSPTLTPFANMHDVFANFATPAVMWKPLHMDLEVGVRITDHLKEAFDDPVEGKEIRVHKALLKIRCQHFRSMFTGHWEEDSNRRCEHIIKQGITVNNAAMLYANAIQYNAKGRKRNADLVHQRKVRAQERASNKMKTTEALQVCDTIHNEAVPHETFKEFVQVQDITMLDPESLDETLGTTLQGVHTPETEFQDEQSLQQTLPELKLEFSSDEDEILDNNVLLHEFQKVVKLNSDLQSENARLLKRVEVLEHLLEQTESVQKTRLAFMRRNRCNSFQYNPANESWNTLRGTISQSGWR
ncbi:hypothetical protein B566_EDAN017097 [Ephemera danica]|nr:hypothetical protein B566_EDAN017097 [Ephemera danica]